MSFPQRRARLEWQRTADPVGTRFYLPSTGAAAVSPAYRPGWEDTTSMPPSRRVMPTAPSATAMTTLSFADADATDRDCLIGQWVSTPLDGGQVITNQDLRLVIRANETTANQDLFLTWAVYVVSNDGSTVRGVLVDVVRDNTELATTTLTNRYANLSVGQVEALDSDRIVVEIGVGGLPATDHDSGIRVGDAATSDLPYDDADTNDFNPYVQFAQTLFLRSETAAQISRTAADAPVYADSVVRSIGLSRTAADAPTHADSVIRVGTFSRTATDAPAYSETAIRVGNFNRTASDATSYADSAARAQVLFRTAADAPSYSDAAARVLVVTRTAADAPQYSESVQATVTILRLASDAPHYADSAARSAGAFARTAADAPAHADSAVRAVTLARTAADAPNYADAVNRVVAAPRTAADAPHYADAAVRALFLPRNAGDAAAYADAAVRTAAMNRAAADAYAYADSVVAGTPPVEPADTGSIIDGGVPSRVIGGGVPSRVVRRGRSREF